MLIVSEPQHKIIAEAAMQAFVLPHHSPEEVLTLSDENLYSYRSRHCTFFAPGPVATTRNPCRVIQPYMHAFVTQMLAASVMWGEHCELRACHFYALTFVTLWVPDFFFKYNNFCPSNISRL